MTVVSDTSPICYLALIGQDELLHRLFGEVLIPRAVHEELNAPDAPEPLRRWLDSKPSWLRVLSAGTLAHPALQSLDSGEREAITLALDLSADLLVVDDRAARATAERLGLKAVGLLGVLDAAARRGQLDISQAVALLRQTSFRASAKLYRELLERGA